MVSKREKSGHRISYACSDTTPTACALEKEGGPVITDISTADALDYEDLEIVFMLPSNQRLGSLFNVNTMSSSRPGDMGKVHVHQISNEVRFQYANGSEQLFKACPEAIRVLDALGRGGMKRISCALLAAGHDGLALLRFRARVDVNRRSATLKEREEAVKNTMNALATAKLLDPADGSLALDTLFNSRQWRTALDRQSIPGLRVP